MQEVKVIEKLVSYLPRFEAEPVVVRTVDYYRPIYAEYVNAFWDVVAEDFSNCNYAMENDIGELDRRFTDSRFIAQASLAQCRDLLTYALRTERFCDGFWRGCVERGHLQALLKRLDVIKGEIERGG